MRDQVTLAELGVQNDPGTSWHPRWDKAAAWDGSELVDLTDDEVLEHMVKPEAANQLDAGVLLEAEDSEHSRRGVI